MFKENKRFRYSYAALLAGLGFGFFVTLVFWDATWDDIRPFVAISIGLAAVKWFIETFCKEWEKE